MNTGANNYDVLIVGGGPAGASAAIHLALRGAQVLLTEQKKFPRAKLCGEFISPECFSHFARLGVLDQMEAAGGEQVAETRFYTRGGRNVSVPSAWFGNENGGGWALGLSRAEMDVRLLERAREVGVEVLEEATATGLLFEEGRVVGARVQLNAKDCVRRASITIDATGRTRALARRVERSDEANGHRLKARMPLVAFKAHLENVRGAEHACEIYFYEGGYGGLNGVEGGLSNLCFIVAARDVRARASDAEKVMREVVFSNRRAAETLKYARVRSEWLAVALESFGRGKLVPAKGLLTVGDAASFIDPFTGSGMLMALESGVLAGEVVAEALPHLRLRADKTFESLAATYRARYDAKFGARLRVCSLLRRAAFAPRIVAEATIRALGVNERLRRRLARATRNAK